MLKIMYNTTMPRGMYRRDPNKKYGIHSLSEEKKQEAYRKIVAKRREKDNYRYTSGAEHHLWKGGRTVEANGYIAIYKPEYSGKKIRKNYVYEHRWVMEQALGRNLSKGEEIHHIDGDRKNNKLDNLMLFASKSEHLKYHWTLPEYKGRWTKK